MASPEPPRAAPRAAGATPLPTAATTRAWHARPWLRPLVSLLLLALLLIFVDVRGQDVWAFVAKVEPWPVAAAILLRPIAVATHAYRSSLLLRAADVGVSVRQLWRAHFFGELLARFIPGNLGVVAYVAKLSPRPIQALVAQLLDRLYFLVVTLSLTALAFFVEGYWWLGAGVAAGGVVLVVGGGALAKSRLDSRVLRLLRADTARLVLRRTPAFLPAYALASLLALAVMCSIFGLLLHACGVEVGVMRVVLVVMLVTLGSALPLTVNGMGAREWIFFAFLSEQVESSAGLVTLAGLSYLVGIASSVIGVLVWGLVRPEAGGARA